MIKTVTLGAVAALLTAATYVPSSYVQDLASDQAYCRQLVDEYSFGMPRNAAASDSLRTDVAIDQCRSGKPDPAIPVLQQLLRDQGFTVPLRL
jgi:hypothetical protein